MSDFSKDFRVPVPPDVHATGNKLAKLIGESLPPGWGFGLFLFTFGENGTMFWVSNAARPDMILALQEWMRKQGQ